jgi:glutamate racemase
MKIGVFDTGRGGILVAQRLRKLLPQHDYVVVDDKQWMPYGNRSPMAIAHLTDQAIQPLLAHKCDVIVIACNTATAAAIDYLRQRYPHQIFVGYEPMIKPAAALSHAKRVTILATPATLKSSRYQRLKDINGDGIAIHEPDTADWAPSIERDYEPTTLSEVIDEIIAHGSDVVVLACTHYLALEDLIRARSGARVIEPTSHVARRIADITAVRQPRQTVRRGPRNS